LKLLGEGGFGRVFKVQHNLDSRLYAIKKIPIHLGLNQDFKQHYVYREILAISQVQHKNVVRYFACWIETQQPECSKINKVVKVIEARLKKENLNKKKQKESLESLSPSASPLGKVDPKKVLKGI